MNDMFNQMQNVIDRKGKTSIENFEDLQKAYDVFRFQFSSRFSMLVDLHEYKIQDIARLIDSSNALVSKSVSLSYRINLENTAKISYKLFHMSIHEFLSEGKPFVKLPASLSCVAKLLAELPEQERTELYADSYKLWQQFSDRRPSEMFRWVFKERYIELCEDNYTDYYGPLMGTPPLSVINNLTNLLDKPEEEEVFIRSRIPFALFVSFMTDQPVDYYFVRDYTQYLPIAYQEAPDKIEYYIVEDKTTKRLISLLLNSTQEVRARLTGYVIERSQPK